ncbi:hypothetical protein GQ55_1G123200 [Panicum hallii var. hallii]|uniref:Uncharacterized protein n=1 Tax=Panicum hallii var. hallii TaxID=1504633 RepID=A0A2T7F4V6_9POAL|nr:hypothetical protein GQ55_1G123200 [Panicum hallii var. hallii]
MVLGTTPFARSPQLQGTKAHRVLGLPHAHSHKTKHLHFGFSSLRSHAILAGSVSVTLLTRLVSFSVSKVGTIGNKFE